jgi:hypothetical protein
VFTWYFQRPERQQALLAALARWRGTPFWSGTAGNAVCQVKADCVSFVAEVMVEIGACHPIKWPVYVTQGGGKPMLDVLLNTLNAIPKLRLVPISQVMPGDILAGSSGRAMHHLAIGGVPGRVWHCLELGGVQEGTLQDPIFQKHLLATYRFEA